MRKTSAYLILSLEGSSHSSATTGTGEGELGMTAGTPSLQDKGVSHTNHAALLILDVAQEGRDVYLSLYPRHGGLFSTGIFRSMRGDRVLDEAPGKKIYRIDNLDAVGIQAYLMRLNFQVQAGNLGEALRARINDPRYGADRARYTADLAGLTTETRGYDALRHNCTTVVVEALRAGGLAVPGVWFFETPTWLDRVATKARASYHPLSFEGFRSGIARRLIDRPQSAFPYEPMMRLGTELGVFVRAESEQVPSAPAPTAAGVGVSPMLSPGGTTYAMNPMFNHAETRESPAPPVGDTATPPPDSLLGSMPAGVRIDLAGTPAPLPRSGQAVRKEDEGEGGEGTRPTV